MNVVHAAYEGWWPPDDDIKNIRRAYLGATANYFVSEGNVNLVQDQIAMRLSNARIVRNPTKVPRDHVSPWPEDNTVVRFACVGRLSPAAKGQDILIKVLARPEWRARSFRLDLQGQGANAGSLIELAALYGVHDVTLGSFDGDGTDFWKEHHALVLASRMEGLPLVVVEAMMCGRVCIVSDVAGNAELLKNGVTGFIARDASVSAFADAMERAWAARDYWPEIGRRAATYVREIIPEDPIGEFCNTLRRFAGYVDDRSRWADNLRR